MPLKGDLWLRYKGAGDPQAREELILSHSHLAKYVVDRIGFRPSGAAGYDDLLGYAVVGLIDAVERFDPSRQIKFETYAITRIRGAVLDGIKAMDWLPRSVRSAGNELKRTMVALEVDLGRPATDEEIAKAMGISVDSLGKLLMDVGQSSLLSLEELVSAGGECSIGSGLGSIRSTDDDPLLSVQVGERRKLLVKAIGELPERERLVIGLYYKEGLTLREIAQVLGVTESRACQLHSKAVTRLHGKLNRHADLMLAAA